MRRVSRFMLIIVVMLFIGCIDVNATNSEQAGQQQQQQGDYTDAPAGTYFNWSPTYPGTFGIKISVYKTDSTIPLSELFFVNKSDDVAYLNAGKKWGWNIKIRDGGYDRLENKLDTPSNKGQWKSSSSTTFRYLAFDDHLSETGSGTTKTMVEYLRGLGNTAQEIKQTLNVGYLNNSDLKNTVLVVEPAMSFYRNSDSSYYFGTYWDFYNLRNELGYNNMYGANGTITNLSNSIKTLRGAINSTMTPEILEFVKQFSIVRPAETSNSSELLGVGIILLSDVIDEQPEYIPCTTNITKGSCSSNIIISEPTDQNCVMYHPKYRYKKLGDCGTIYCSEDIKTETTNFTNTFQPIIRAGSYFQMGSIEVDITKTCYLKVNDGSSCNNLTSYITEENAGTIKLSLINDYTLVKDGVNSTFDVNCANSSCTKAIAKQHIEYVLEPNVNKYISIKDMAGTGTGPGNDIYDLETEHLTTPILLSTGTHKYSVDYSNSVFSDSINRLVKIDEQEVPSSNLILTYDYTQQLMSADLIIKDCEYNVENPNEDCPICTSECCNSKCEPIDCECDPTKEPCGFPNLIYRPINLEEPFPGEDGAGRTPGTNWSGIVKDLNGNEIRKPNGQPYTKEEYYINYNRGYDDYDIYQGEPLYVIKLDYEALSAIREYNDTNDYNDFELVCTNGEKCISEFLRGQVSRFNINLISSGLCKDITTSDFDSCISRNRA